jgi:hypothetical protein
MKIYMRACAYLAKYSLGGGGVSGPEVIEENVTNFVQIDIQGYLCLSRYNAVMPAVCCSPGFSALIILYSIFLPNVG